MHIVINIPDELYEGIKRCDGSLETEYVCDELINAIDNGTILPKGHGRLIDGTALSGEFFCEADLTDSHTCYESIMALLEKEPTIIEADKTESEVEK